MLRYIGVASANGLEIRMLMKPERFTQYLDSKHLPFNTVETRNNSTHDIIFALTAHAPSPGVDYGPVNDLIVSVVLRSNYGSVVRDVGFGRKNFTETPGCILVTPPMTSSYWYFEGMPQILHICFPHDYLRKYLDDSEKDLPDLFGHLARNPIHDPLISMLANRLWAMSAASDKYARICSDQIVETILVTLFAESKAGTVCNNGSQRPSAGLAPWRLKQITELVERRMSEGVSVDELAKIVGLSTHYFLRAFKASTGHTPHQWLSLKRIENAKKLLGGTNLPITDISMDLGFSSPAHFSGRFRQMVGVTPSAWRKEFTLSE